MTKVQNQLSGQRIVFSWNGVGRVGHSHAKQKQSQTLIRILHQVQKNDLHVKSKTIKLIKENREKLS